MGDFWFFFFKQKTAYELRISDWSSDVCSSDLQALGEDVAGDAEALGELLEAAGADEGRADDHRRPPVAEDVDGARHRAVPVVEASATHVTSIISCLNERTARS